jgi:hypothetical protein
LLTGSKGLVRVVYPDRWRVDFEADDGSFLTEALVVGPYFPAVHTPEDPSHVGYMHVRGGPDTVCWPMPHRRLVSQHDGQSEAPERRYFHLPHFIFRSGDITLRVTRDNRFVLESEAGDWLLYDQARREFHLHAPSIFLGTTDDQRRVEYQQDESLRAFAPLMLLGSEVGDRIEYREGVEILLQAPLIKLTAEEIILDPVSIKFGHGNATERVVLGDLLMAFYNTFVTLFNAHTHSNVQNGPGTSGAPVTPTAAFTDALLSDVARVSKTGL